MCWLHCIRVSWIYANMTLCVGNSSRGGMVYTPSRANVHYYGVTIEAFWSHFTWNSPLKIQLGVHIIHYTQLCNAIQSAWVLSISNWAHTVWKWFKGRVGGRGGGILQLTIPAKPSKINHCGDLMARWVMQNVVVFAPKDHTVYYKWNSDEFMDLLLIRNSYCGTSQVCLSQSHLLTDLPKCLLFVLNYQVLP